MKKYKKRIIEEIILRKLQGKGAVLIQGIKGCGKTTTAEQIAESILYMSNPHEIEQNLSLASIKPKLLLEGNKI